MGVQFSKTFRKIFVEEEYDPSKSSSVHLIQDLDIESERIDLRAVGIVNIPPEMMQFTKLSWLQLSQNVISQIPPNISALQNLKTLRLFSNYLEELPPELGQLKNLTTLDAGKNQIKIICPEICELASLTELNLYWNQIKVLPDEIGNLKNLKILNLYINRLSELPATITELTELETLDLAHNHILDFSPAIGDFKKLSALNLVGNGCKNLPSHLINLSGLQKFDARCNSFEELPDGICDLPIRNLLLQNNHLKILPDNIGNMKELKEFHLESNNLTSLPDSIGQLNKLELLYAYENQLEMLPSSVGKLSLLVQLDLTENHLKSLPIELENLQRIQVLFLSKNQFKEVPPCIGNMNTLLQLDMINNQLTSLPNNLWHNLSTNLGKLNFNLNTIQSLPENLFKLKSLVFLEIACNQLEEIPEAISQLKQLNFLNVGHNKLKYLPNSLSKMESLRKLYVSYNDLADFQWPEEYSKLSNLKEFVCAGNKQNSIPKFLVELPSLFYLDLSGNLISQIPSNIKNIESLVTLILSHNQIEVLPHEITELMHLTEIDLCNNKLKSLPEDLGKLELLVDLDFSGNELEELPDLRDITGLLQLKVAHNNIVSPPRVDPNCWTSTEGNINARSKKGKYTSEFDSLFKTKLHSVVSKRLSRWIDSAVDSPQFIFSWAETRGRRPDQQDTICVVKNIQGQNLHYLGLYDGHSGTVSPEVASSVLHQIFIDRLNHLSLNSFDAEAIIPLFSESFGILQNELTKHSVNDGAAVNVVFLTQTMIFCANAGDSRAIVIRNGAAYPLSTDHKPDSESERKRIEEAGGFVTESKRVNGVLALSRALGDCEFSPAITHEPDVIVTQIEPEDKFIIMACDGLWDMLTNEEVAELVQSVSTAAEAAVMLRDVAYVLGSTDNISVIVAEIHTHN